MSVTLSSKKLTDGIMTHACVSVPDVATVNLVPGSAHKLTFVPPPHSFVLCHYKVALLEYAFIIIAIIIYIC